MDWRLKINIDLTDHKLHPRPDAISHIVSLIEQAFISEPVEIDRVDIFWVREKE